MLGYFTLLVKELYITCNKSDNYGKITVLLVEDEQTLAMIIKDTLEGQNFIIHTAADGEEDCASSSTSAPTCWWQT